MKRIGLSLMAMMVAVLCMAQTRGAQYPGGDEAYREFLKKNIKYPVTSKNNSVEGYCNLKFKVKVDGTTENVCVVGSTGDADLDNEALRIVSLLKFDPAMNDGEKVECEAKCSVLFQLDQPKLEKVENLKSGIGFPGGVEKIRKYVEERVEYPQSCLDDSISGACQVFFVVNADSTISNKRIMWTSGNIELDREAIRQISRLQGLLSPAVNDKDKPVASSFHLQIEFCAYRKCYTTFLRNVITSKLSPDDSIKSECNAAFKVGADGKIFDVTMAKSSGDAAVDGKIIKILKEIAHIEPAIVANKSVASEESVSVPAGKVSNLIEEHPEFPGGTKALFKWIQDNLKYPVISRSNGSQGLAVIAFIVNKDGSVSDVRVAESTNDVYLDYEAMRIVKMMPKWSPGTIGGKPVEVSFKMPIRFRLQ